MEIVTLAVSNYRSHSAWNLIVVAENVLQLLFAWAFLQGKGWVRWALLVPIAVGWLTSSSYFQHASMFGIFNFCLHGLLHVGALILLFLRPSNDWFRNKRNAR